MPVRASITIKDPRVVARYQAAKKVFDDPTRLHQRIALQVVNGSPGVTALRAHIRSAAQSRHKTADRLGAKRTGYLERAAQNIEAKGDAKAAQIIINNSSGIFSRINGPVTIKPVRTKWLWIPVHRISYGKSPLNFPNRLRIVIKNDKVGFAFLRKTPKSDAPRAALDTKPKKVKARKARKASQAKAEQDPETPLLFVLKKQVTLPQDRGLMLSDNELAQHMHHAVTDELEAERQRIVNLLG